jgi:outer membrane protein
MKFLKITFFLLIVSFGKLSGQNTEMDLQNCIEYAFKNNLQVQQSELNIRQSKLSNKQAKWAYAPSANASFRHGANFGRSIDFTSYQYVDQATQSSQFSVNFGQPVFTGMQLRNRILQSSVDVQASEMDAQQVKDNVGLSVAQAYLSILLAEEQILVLKEQLKVTEAQYQQTLKFITAGRLPENTKFDLEAQIARNEQAVVNAENGLEFAYLNLKVLINMNPSEKLKIKKVDFKLPENDKEIIFDDIYNVASNTLPGITAARIREQSAKMGVKIAKGALLPTISAYGSVFTNFSSAAKETSFQTVTQNVNVNIFGLEVPLGFPTTIPVQGNTIPYFKQIWDNIYSNVGVNMSVPIFNGLQTRIAIDRANLAVKIAELNSQTVQNQLKSDIQRAINDVRAAQKSYVVADKTLKATKASAENTKKRFELGVVNGFEMVSAQNMLISAESTLIQTKFDLIFKTKVLDFYRGNRLLTE